MIEIWQGDITTLAVDAIVNAANRSLLGGGGVDGAIHSAAGSELFSACLAVGGCPTGAAKITPGFKLPASHVIHTVGPVWRGGEHGEIEQLASCYRASFACARAACVRSIAFPAISCGVYGFPFEAAATIALHESHMAYASGDFSSIVLVQFSEDGAKRMQQQFLKYQLGGHVSV